jgi:hypothetical protein
VIRSRWVVAAWPFGEPGRCSGLAGSERLLKITIWGAGGVLPPVCKRGPRRTRVTGQDHSRREPRCRLSLSVALPRRPLPAALVRVLSLAISYLT